MKKEVKIGLSGIAALIILFFGINYLKGISMFTPETYYLVDFTDVNGLAKSSPVYANGLKVGIVRDITYNFGKPGHVTVGIEMDEAMKVPQGSHAELISEMLGTVKMNLHLNIDNPNIIGPNDTIEGIANPGILGVAEKELMPKVDNMIPKIDSILTSLNALLADPALTQTLHNAEKITASLTATSNQLQQLMKNDIPHMANNIIAITEDLKGMTGNLKQVDFAATFAEIDATLESVHQLTTKLNSNDNTLGKLLNDPSVYDNLNQTTANAASLLEDFKAHPKRYIHFSVFGRKDK